ncbi:uncharacterized protein HD556DRAFT_1239430 [Suillus plorans]|uniref:Uncharacterized protein n=1 Tax=Suillus plorans TaxID=116603 RepID=A0A9P7APG9_9AGAM|nr:uncharacterized protein HD556DRAFT_1239430 [Suillus plorans]KAG1792457.1 hypothetical protein HD556DRAFT_1239430 [Suillus plorans]
MTPGGTGGLDARLFDMAALNLLSKGEEPIDEPPPKIALERGKLLQEVRKVLEGQGGDKKAVSLVVIGTKSCWHFQVIFC